MLVIYYGEGAGRTGLMATVLRLKAGKQWQPVASYIQALGSNTLTLPSHIGFINTHYSV
nr:hypothetical protein [uncultured Amphritea sp.]